MELLWHTLLGFGMLLAWGGLLAAVTVLVPRLLDYLEPAPLSAPLGVRPGERPAPAPPEPPPVTGPPRAPAAEPARPKVTVPTEDPALAAAVAVALTLYLEETTPGAFAPPAPAPGGPVNLWGLSGRWQTMQQRRDLRKRT
ncbi:MAG: hypothetical protein K6T55_06255 [Syntrophobacterales bacterium]|nr:hypothetical protein [Syntrophobacterales bacterium]